MTMVEPGVSCNKGKMKGRIGGRLMQVVAGIESVIARRRSRYYIRLHIISDGRRLSS